ncbi:MAG: hypothetical protein GY906_39745 [bacterium]|nr:hypothetical protein [bacterium]
MSQELRFNHVGPQFKVKDVADAVAFYSTALGFEVDYFSGDPPSYAVVFRDEVYVHLCSGDDWAKGLGPSAAFIAVKGIAELWEHVEEFADIEMIYPLDDRDYGDEVRFSDFAIADLDGNILRIGEPIKGERRTIKSKK